MQREITRRRVEWEGGGGVAKEDRESERRGLRGAGRNKWERGVGGRKGSGERGQRELEARIESHKEKQVGGGRSRSGGRGQRE